eukprot:355236-Chlamydomonas_euryale.AAC.8
MQVVWMWFAGDRMCGLRLRVVWMRVLWMRTWFAGGRVGGLGLRLGIDGAYLSFPASFLRSLDWLVTQDVCMCEGRVAAWD